MGPGLGSKRVEELIGERKDWKGGTMARLQALIRQADPDIVEEVKWRKPSNPAGVPVWSHNGVVCNGNFLKDSVRITFEKGGGA